MDGADVSKKKVLFVLPSLDGGGAQRVVIRLLRMFDRRKYAPQLVLIEREGVFLSEVPPDVPVFDLGRYGAGGRLKWLGRFASLVRDEKPDAILSFLWFANSASVLARFMARSGCALLLSERLSIEGATEGVLDDLVRRVALSLLYPSADRIVPNTEAMRRQLLARHPYGAAKVVAIPNPIGVDEIVAMAGPGEEGAGADDAAPLVAGMGRLVPQKGFDLLIRAMALSRTPFRLVLLGKGSEEERLRGLARGLGIAARVEFAGFQCNPYVRLRKASVFVLPSRFEGFPNALVEAMALGVPCVSTRCPTGPEEIVTDGVDGLLVPAEDPAAIAVAIDRLLGDAALRGRLGRAGRERVGEYEAGRIVRRFEALVDEVTA